MTVDRRCVLPLLAGLPALASACGRTTGGIADEGATGLRQPAVPTKAPAGTQTQLPNIPPRAPADVQVLPVRITNGEFDHDRYLVQAGALQLHITAGSGGPYGIRIDELLQARA